MMSYQEQAELARLQHEARLHEAAEARRFAHLRPRRTLNLLAWVSQLWGEQRGWFSQSQPVDKGKIAAMRHQTS